MKRVLCIVLCVLLLPLWGCSGTQKYESIRYDLFDTEIRLIAYCDSQSAMDKMAEIAFARLEEYHRLFDIYNHYDGVVNLYDVNHAAGAAVSVSGTLMELLQFGRDAYDLTGGRVNIALGAVLSLWHDARDTGVLPEDAALQAAAQHCDIGKVQLDEAGGTVTLLDPALQLDVGAVAKGWAAGKAADALRAAGYTDFILSAGGNVVAAGTRQGSKWQVGVQDPSNPDALCATVSVSDLCVVTSGGYQRYVEINGVRYHHIIDPDTLYPGDYVLSATVICTDSGLADALSTACFLLPPAEAQALAKKNGARLILVDKTGAILDTDAAATS